MAEKKPKVVVIGGGTGTFTVLRGLKQYHTELDISAIISMADSGGSTGRLRDEFGQLPVGDVRMALAALSRDVNDHEELLRELFLYRFERGSGLSGHNFGNLLLTALTDILGSEAAAVAAASKLLRVRGSVIPVTTDNVHLMAVYDDGVEVVGEHAIDEPTDDRYGHRIVSLATRPSARVNPAAQEAIAAADLIVLGPGDLYASLLANVVVTGMPEALQASSGRLVYIANLMERRGQSEGLSVADCVVELGAYIGREPDVVLVNSAPLPADVVERYKEQEGVTPVFDDADRLSLEVIRADLLSAHISEQDTTDVVTRSFIRHDSEAITAVLRNLLQ